MSITRKIVAYLHKAAYLEKIYNCNILYKPLIIYNDDPFLKHTNYILSSDVL